MYSLIPSTLANCLINFSVASRIDLLVSLEKKYFTYPIAARILSFPIAIFLIRFVRSTTWFSSS